LALLVTLGAAGCSGLKLDPVGSTTAPSPNPTASTGTTSPGQAMPTEVYTPPPPDAVLSDLALVTVPSYCQLPAATASSGTVSASAGGGRGALVLSGPVGPLFADVNGDRAKEALVEYRCNAGNTDWPSMILVVGGGGKSLGFVKLADVARTDHADITGWRAAEGGAVVNWVAYGDGGRDKRPYENLLTLKGPTVSFAATDRGKALAGTTIVDGPGGAAFVTPNGRTACALDGESVTCEVDSPSWQPTLSRPAECDGRDYDGTLVLKGGLASYGCAGGAAFRAASGSSENDWVRQGQDPSIRSPKYGELAGVAYGRTLTTGSVSCAVATSGVTCSDVMTGHGFTVSGDAARIF